MNQHLAPSHYYPVFLDIRRRRCLVVGGGQVARRKAESLLEGGAEVSVISPKLCPGLAELGEGGRITLIQRQYRDGDLEGAFLAIAATDDSETNARVAMEARSGGVLVNVVDDAARSDFIAPSCLRRGDVVIAVSTSGSSPALARRLRTRLEEEFGNEYAALAEVVGQVRAELKRRGTAVSADAWQQALELDALAEMVRRGAVEQARERLLESLQNDERG